MPAVTVANPLTLPAITIADGAAARSRPVLRVVNSIQTYEGEGFPVRRPFPGLERSVADPFILLDQMGEVQYGVGEAKGAPDHPHRGFETASSSTGTRPAAAGSSRTAIPSG